MNGLKRNSLSLLALCLFFSCAGREKSFLYEGDFFRKEGIRFFEPYQLTIDISSEFYPSVSPDGKHILYVSDKSGSQDLWLYDILSRTSFRVTYHSSDDTMPSFSGNGEKIVFVSFRRSGLGDLFLLETEEILKRCRPNLPHETVKELLKDDGAAQITKNDLPETEPLYIGNSTVYFVSRDGKGIQNIFRTRDSFNKKREQMTFSGAISPAVSPGKKLLAYVDVSGSTNRKNHIVLVDLSSGETRPLTAGRSIEARPHFVTDTLLVYASHRLDSNRDGKLDASDSSALFSLDLATGRERQLTPDRFISMYPVSAPLYNGVLIFTSTLMNNIDLWMLPLEGYLPDLKEQGATASLAADLSDPYLKIMAYKDMTQQAGDGRTDACLELARLYRRLGFPDRSAEYLKQAGDTIAARMEVILQQEVPYTSKITRLSALGASSNVSAGEKRLIDLAKSRLFRQNKAFAASMPLLENIIASHTNRDEILFTAFRNLAEDYLQFNNPEKIRRILPAVTNYGNLKAKIEFQNRFIDNTMAQASDRDAAYTALISLFKNDPDFYPNLLLHYASFLKEKKLKKALDLLRYVRARSRNPYFKVQALYRFYEINPDEEFLVEIMRHGTDTDRARRLLFNRHLTAARDFFQAGDYLSARGEYAKVAAWDTTHTGALTGKLRCDFKLLKPDEEKYLLLLKQFDSALPYDPAAAYLKGYCASLIYSHYYTLFRQELRKAQSARIRDTSGPAGKEAQGTAGVYLKKLNKYFKEAEENLRRAYRIKPDFVEVYLTLGWLYQIHAGVDSGHFTAYMENSIPFYQSALHFNNEEKDAEMEAVLCLNLANNYFSLGNYSQALQFYNKKFSLHKEFQTREQEAFFHYHAGYCAWFLENDAPASAFFQKALALFTDLKEESGAYQCLVFLAMLEKVNGRFRESLDYYAKAVRLLEEFRLTGFEKERLIREMGTCYRELNDQATALEYLKKALAVIPRDKKPAWWERPGLRVGMFDVTVPVWSGQVTLGQSFAYQGFTNRDEQKLLYSLISDTYQRFLDYRKAIRYLLQKKTLLEEDKNADALPFLYNNLGLLYYRLNRYAAARNYFLEANRLLRREKKLKDPRGIIVNNLNMMEILLKKKNTPLSQKESEEVRSLLDESVLLAAGHRLSDLLIKAHNAFGTYHLLQALEKSSFTLSAYDGVKGIERRYQSYKDALDHFQKARALAVKSRDTRQALKLTFNTALVYYHTRDFTRALSLFGEVADQASKFLLDDLKWKSRYYILQTDLLTGRGKDPEPEYRELLEGAEGAPKGFLYTISDDPATESVFDEYADLLVRKGDYKEALFVLERKKNLRQRELLLSYPFDFGKQESGLAAGFRNLEEEMIRFSLSAQDDLMKKFDNKKRFEYEARLEELAGQRKEVLRSLPSGPLSRFLRETGRGEIRTEEPSPAVILFHAYRTNIRLFLIEGSNIRLISVKADPGLWKTRLEELTEKMKNGQDIADLLPYFRTALGLESEELPSGRIIVIPEGPLFQLPFSSLMPERSVACDISLRQARLNQKQQIKKPLRFQVLNADSELNRWSASRINEKQVSQNDLAAFGKSAFILASVDGLAWDRTANYRVRYNEEYDFSMNDLFQMESGPFFLSLEKTAPDPAGDETDMLLLLVPLYYHGVTGVSISDPSFKEKHHIRFWETFHSFTNHDLMERYYRALAVQREREPLRQDPRRIFGSLPSAGISGKIPQETPGPEPLLSISRATDTSPGAPDEAMAAPEKEDPFLRAGELVSSNLAPDAFFQGLWQILAGSPSRADTDNIFSMAAIHFRNSATNLCRTLCMYKNHKNNQTGASTGPGLKPGTAFADFTFLKEKLYCAVRRAEKEIFVFSLEKEEFDEMFRDWTESVREKDEEEYRETRERLGRLFRNRIGNRLDEAEEILIYPEGKLFFLPWNGLISLKSNQTLRVVRSYAPLPASSGRALTFQAYGVRKNSPGRLIMDFSYKEVDSLLAAFPRSAAKLNPDRILTESSANAFHMGLPVRVGSSNIRAESSSLNRAVILDEALKDRDWEMLLFTRASFDPARPDIAPLLGFKTKTLIFPFWRENDAVSARFIEQFYLELKNVKSADRAFRRARKTVEEKFPNPLLSDNFIMLE